MARYYPPRLTDDQLAAEVALFKRAVDRCKNGPHLHNIPEYVWRQFARGVHYERQKQENTRGR